MTDVNVTETDVVRLIIYIFVIMVYDVIEPGWKQGDHQGPVCCGAVTISF